MATPESLRSGAADSLAAVQRAAASFVESTRRACAARERELDGVAELLSLTDEEASKRLLASARAATAEALQRAEEQAEEVRGAAANRILRMVVRYAGTLAAETRSQNEGRSRLQADLVAGVARVDAPAARAIAESIEAADSDRLSTASRQAEVIAGTATEAMQRQGPRA